MKELERLAYFTFALSLFIFLLSAGKYFLIDRQPVSVITLHAWVNVSHTSGVDLNTELLTFGILAAPGSAIRYLSVKNDYSFPVIARISAEGTIAPLLSYERNVSIEAKEKRRIAVSVIASQDVKREVYDGTLLIEFFPA